jgi:uncharacterized protein (TIGR04222 family)
MSWVWQNMIAEMYGPYFLGFYGSIIVAVVVACHRALKAADETDALTPPRIPAKLDPYEVAYLRGGENEVARVAIASLVERGLLQIVEKKKMLVKQSFIDRGRAPDPRELRLVEAKILGWSGFPALPGAVFQPDGIARSIEPECLHYRRVLDENRLVTTPEVREKGYRLWYIGSLAILSLGVYKLIAAIMNGHRNILFLVIMGAIGFVSVSVVCLKRPRLSKLGKGYLEQLKLAFSGLKDESSESRRQDIESELAGDPLTPKKRQAAVAHGDALMILGIFGLSALSGTEHARLATMFTRAASANGGCGGGGCGGGGGGCGGGGGGCGGGCGGCGG